MKRDYFYIVGIIILCIFFSFRECQHNNNTDNLISEIANYKGEVKIEKLKNGALVYTNKVLKLNSEKQLKELAENLNNNMKEMLKNFKSVSNVTYVTNEFNSYGDTSKNIVTIPCDFKPFKVRHGSDSTYKLVMTVAKNYTSVDSLNIKDSLSLVFGRRKQGFMKYDYAVDINHNNHLMKTTSIKTYQYTPDKKWYERTLVHMGVGGAIVIGVIESLKYLIP